MRPFPLLIVTSIRELLFCSMYVAYLWLYVVRPVRDLFDLSNFLSVQIVGKFYSSTRVR